jgi:hypothetical protein
MRDDINEGTKLVKLTSNNRLGCKGQDVKVSLFCNNGEKCFFQWTEVVNAGIKCILTSKYPQTLDLVVRISLFCEER